MQPEWETVYETDYSALYRDKTGEYAPELEIREVFDDSEQTDEDGNETVEVWTYRFSLDRLKLVADDEDPLKQWLVPEAYEADWPHAVSQYQEWFTEYLPEVAESTGSTAAELIAALVSEDIGARAWAYESIGGYHGWENLDSYPERGREAV